MNIRRKYTDISLIDQKMLATNYLVKSICEAESYSTTDYEPMVDKGNQSLRYTINTQNNQQHVLKIYLMAVDEEAEEWAGIGGSICKDINGKFDRNLYKSLISIQANDLLVDLSINTNPNLKNSPYIVTVHQAGYIEFYDADEVCLSFFYTIMEKCSSIHSSEFTGNEKAVLRLGTHISQGLHVLHNCKDLDSENFNLGIFHNDVKPPNILKRTKNDNTVYLLTDFGASILKGTSTSVGFIKAATYDFCAPELASGFFSKRADLYSLCATMYNLITSKEKPLIGRVSSLKKTPTGKLSGTVVYTKKMPAPAYASKQLQELLTNGLEFDRKKRKIKNAEEMKAALQKIQLLHAREAFKNKDYNLCRSYVDDIESAVVDDPEVCTKLGTIYILLKNNGKAKEYLSKAAKSNSTFTPMAYLILAIMNKAGLPEKEPGEKETADYFFIRAMNHPSASNELKSLARNIQSISLPQNSAQAFTNATGETLRLNDLKRYDVITFSDDDKVVVLARYDRNGRKFVYVNEILPDESDVTDKYKVMEIHLADNTLEKIIDPDVLEEILPEFHKILKEYVN